jgi:thioesterase domain-containing protein/acyl carrier protein
VSAREDTPGDLRLVAYCTVRDGAAPAVAALREHIRGRVPPYMLPTTFVVLDSIPLTPNGKVDRKLLPPPDQAHISVQEKHEPPATGIEEQLAAIWARVLKVRTVGRHDSFFDLGGNSLLAVTVFSEIEKTFGRHLPLATLFNFPTVAGLASNLGVVEPGTANWPSLIPIQESGTKPRFFCVHGAGGNVLLYRNLVAHLGTDYPFYGLQSRGLDGKTAPLATVEEMAAAYLEEIQRFQPHGPYCLGGYCLGGTIALEMAGLLRKQGEEAAFLGLMDTYNYNEAVQVSWLSDFAQRLKFHAGNFRRLRPAEVKHYLAEKIRVARDGEFKSLIGLGNPNTVASATGDTLGRTALQNIQAINDHAVTKYRPKPYPGKLTLFKPEVNYSAFPDPRMGWGEIALDGVDIVELPMNPHAMLVEPFVQQLASALAAALDRTARTPASAERLVSSS